MSGETLAMKAELDASGVASGFQQINSHLSQFGIQTGTASTSLGGLGTMLGTLANPMTAVAAGALAVGSALTTSVGVAGNFQQSMANVTAIMGGNEAEMQAMSAAAREAGATTQFSATQAADALSYMAGAGWNSTQATAGLKDTLTMAAAGGMDLAAAGDLMTGTIAQFNLQATDAGRVSNVLAAGASATNTSVSQLGQGMTVVGATANAFGMSLESTTAALGALSNGNIKGAEGGTALRGILASLATQSGPAAAALSELGLSAADVNPETNQLSDTMQLLEERGMTATQAIAIFGRENVSAATYLAAHSSELDGLQTSITGTTKASEMAAIQTNTYQGAMGELSSAIEEAEISLGDALLPTLTEGVKFFTDLVTVGTAAGKAIYDFAGDVSTALDPVKEAFSYTPMGMISGAVSDTASSAWGDLKEWAGIGDEAGSAVAKGVEENKDLAESPAKAMTSDTGKAAAAEAADVFGDTYLQAIKDLKVSEGLATYVASGFSDMAALAAVNNQNSKANDEIDRTFEYMDQQYKLHLSKGSSGWFGSLFSGDKLLNSESIFQENLDEEAMFEAATGLPAPAEGTAAYYDMVGNAAKAEQIRLQEKLSEGATQSWIVSSEDAIKSQMSALGESAASALKDGILKESEVDDLMGLSVELNKLKALYPEEFKAIGGDSANKFIEAMKAGDYASAAKIAADEFGTTFAKEMTEFNTTKAAKFDLSEWIKNPDMSDITSLTDFVNNIFQPAVVETATEALSDYNLGLDEGYRAGKDLLMAFADLAQVMPQMFTQEQRSALQAYDGSLVSTEAALTTMSKKIEKSTSNLKEFKEEIELCEPLSEDLFAQWQEGSESGVFFEGYVGASYGTNFENYLKRLSSQYSSVADSAERLQAAHNGQYIAPGMADLSLDIDTAKADENLAGIEASLDSIIGKVKDPLYLEIHFAGEKSVATTGAVAAENTQSLASTWQSEISNMKVGVDVDRTDFDELLKDIAETYHTAVVVDVSANAAQIRAIVDEAIADALSNIRV